MNEQTLPSVRHVNEDFAKARDLGVHADHDDTGERVERDEDRVHVAQLLAEACLEDLVERDRLQDEVDDLEPEVLGIKERAFSQ